jgi:hypothetical protein
MSKPWHGFKIPKIGNQIRGSALPGSVTQTTKRQTIKAGKRNKLTGQVGEHLVAAILGTKGYYASPYSGNVPGFDITAVDSDTLKSFPIQVKTSNGGSLLRTNIDRWVEFSVGIDKRQKLDQ